MATEKICEYYNGMDTKLVLEHAQQPFPWGCMQYSLFSLTRDERILEDTTECSEDRFSWMMGKLGYHFVALWADAAHEQLTGPHWWNQVVGSGIMKSYNRPMGPDEQPIVWVALVGVKSARFKNTRHMVSVVVRAGIDLPVTVFDPALPRPKDYESLESFAESDYGLADLVWQVTLRPEQDLLPCYGPAMSHVTDELREKWVSRATNPAT